MDGWSKDDEALAFEMIAGQYLNKNFGRLGKSDFEVLIFILSIYLKMACLMMTILSPFNWGSPNRKSEI